MKIYQPATLYRGKTGAVALVKSIWERFPGSDCLFMYECRKQHFAHKPSLLFGPDKTSIMVPTANIPLTQKPIYPGIKM
jgi:hypothetical protein